MVGNAGKYYRELNEVLIFDAQYTYLMQHVIKSNYRARALLWIVDYGGSCNITSIKSLSL